MMLSRRKREKINRLFRLFLTMSLISGWILAGWPHVWQNPSFPPDIPEAKAAAGTGEGLVIYNDTSTDTTPSWKTWDSSHTLSSAGTLTHNMNAYAYLMWLEASPGDGDEVDLLMLSASTGTANSTEAKVYTFDNGTSSWSSGTSLTTTAPDAARAGKVYISAAHGVEGNSGDGLVVYTDSTDLLYRTRTSGGAWSGTASTLQAGDISYSIDVACDKNSDNCIAIWADNDGANYPIKAAVWNGSSWGTVTTMDSASQYSNGVKELTLIVGAGWEGTSGDGITTWVDSSGNWRYNTYSGGSWGTSATISVLTGVGTTNKPAGIRLEGDANSNNVAMFAGDGSGKDVELTIWSGTAWGTAFVLCNGISPQCDASKAPSFDVVWDNASKAYVYVSPKSGSGIRYTSWTSGGGWSTASTVGSTTYKGAGVDADTHYNSDRMFLAADDGTNKDDVDYWYYTTAGGWSTAAGLGATSTQGKPRQFALAYFDGRNETVATPTFTLNAYRWYVDSDAENVTDPWGNPDIAQNTAITPLPASNDPPGSTQELRLRVNFTVNTAALTASSQQFILQYKTGTDANCTTGTWTDVGVEGGAGIWRYATSTVTDGTTLTASQLSPVSDVLEVYAKSDPTTTNPNSATVGQEIEYDFHIEHNGAADATQYSFRVIESDATVFDAYTNCPTLTTEPGTADLMRHGNFFSDGVEQGFFWAD